MYQVNSGAVNETYQKSSETLFETEDLAEAKAFFEDIKRRLRASWKTECQCSPLPSRSIEDEFVELVEWDEDEGLGDVIDYAKYGYEEENLSE